MLFFRAFMDAGQADRLAAGVAPLLPLLLVMLALGFVMRRIVGGNSWVIAIFVPLSAAMALSMFMPMRIDHHGWQLAMTLVARSEEHTSELQSLMRISYAVFCLKKKTKTKTNRMK